MGDLVSLPVEYFGQAYLPMIHHAIRTGRLAAQNLVMQSIPLKKPNGLYRVACLAIM